MLTRDKDLQRAASPGTTDDRVCMHNTSLCSSLEDFADYMLAYPPSPPPVRKFDYFWGTRRAEIIVPVLAGRSFWTRYQWKERYTQAKLLTYETEKETGCGTSSGYVLGSRGSNRQR